MLISLFITCYNDTLYPRTGQAVVTVLERLGHTLEFRAAQTCCGQMHYNNGYRPEAFSLMEKFLDDYRDAETICIPSASCVAMIRDHYPVMAAESGNPALIDQVNSLVPRVFEFSELLVDKLGIEDTGAFFPHAVTLHSSCHSLRSLHVGDKPGTSLRERPRPDVDPARRIRPVLRLRWHLCDQERGRFRCHTVADKAALHPEYDRPRFESGSG